MASVASVRKKSNQNLLKRKKNALKISTSTNFPNRWKMKKSMMNYTETRTMGRGSAARRRGASTMLIPFSMKRLS